MIENFNFSDCSNSSNWDNELLEYGYPHVYQSSAFAEQYKHHVGSGKYQPIFLYISDSGRVIGQCLIAVSKRRTAQWLYGPVVKDSHLNFYDNIIAQMMEYLQKQGILAVDFATTQIFYDKNIYKENCQLYSHICETNFVDLEDSLDDIKMSFHSSVRKNVRKCNSAGVTVEITNDLSMIPLYLEMLSFFRKSLGFSLPPFYPNIMSMALFSRDNTSMDIALASMNGTYIAAMGYVTYGKLVTEIAVAESEEYVRLKLPANDLIKVKAIEVYKARGMKYYDITGGKKYPSNPKEQNINKFKRKFSNKLAEYQGIEQQYFHSNSLAHNLNVGVLKAENVILKAGRMFKKILNVRPKRK